MSRVDEVKKARWGYSGFTEDSRGFDAGGVCVDADDNGRWSAWEDGTDDVVSGESSGMRAAMRQARRAAVAIAEKLDARDAEAATTP